MDLGHATSLNIALKILPFLRFTQPNIVQNPKICTPLTRNAWFWNAHAGRNPALLVKLNHSRMTSLHCTCKGDITFHRKYKPTPQTRETRQKRKTTKTERRTRTQRPNAEPRPRTKPTRPTERRREPTNKVDEKRSPAARCPEE